MLNFEKLEKSDFYKGAKILTNKIYIMKTEIKTNDYIYIFYDGKRYLRKIKFCCKNIIEFFEGWTDLDKLEPNPNKKSKIKYILNYGN